MFCLDKIIVFLAVGYFMFQTCSLGHHIEGHSRLNLKPGKESVSENRIGYYMFNVTNPKEVEEGGKPIFDEVGPYVYKEIQKKYNVRKEPGANALRYDLIRYWVFAPELSGGRLETDFVNVINIPMLILATKLSGKNLPTAFNNILVDEIRESGDNLIRVNEQVGDILYHGMNVSIYTEILADVLQGNVPPEFQDGLFALHKNQDGGDNDSQDNGSHEGEFVVSTDKNNLGAIVSWDNHTELSYWKGEYCNKIDGTDGFFFAPGVTEHSILKVFYRRLCRSIYLTYAGKKEYKGIPVYDFEFPEDLLEDARVDERNLCFCGNPVRQTYEEQIGNKTVDPYATCLKRGFIDYGACKQESPLLVSFPHFLYADKSYLEGSEGLNPDVKKHRTEFLIEPKTGALLSALRKFQFNVKIQPLDNVSYFKNATFQIFPVFWQYREYTASDEEVESVKEELVHLAEAKNNKDLYGEQSEDPSLNKNSVDRRRGVVESSSAEKSATSEPSSISPNEIEEQRSISSSSTVAPTNVFYVCVILFGSLLSALISHAV